MRKQSRNDLCSSGNTPPPNNNNKNKNNTLDHEKAKAIPNGGGKISPCARRSVAWLFRKAASFGCSGPYSRSHVFKARLLPQGIITIQSTDWWVKIVHQGGEEVRNQGRKPVHPETVFRTGRAGVRENDNVNRSIETNMDDLLPEFGILDNSGPRPNAWTQLQRAVHLNLNPGRMSRALAGKAVEGGHANSTIHPKSRI